MMSWTINKVRRKYEVRNSGHMIAVRDTLFEAEKVIRLCSNHFTNVSSTVVVEPTIEPEKKRTYNEEKQYEQLMRMRAKKGITLFIEDVERDFQGVEITKEAIMEKYDISLKKASTYYGHAMRRAKKRIDAIELEGYIRPDAVSEMIEGE